MKLPVDLEEKVRLPAKADGKGYPYRLSARDLMENFVFAAVDVPEFVPVFPYDLPNGIKVEPLAGSGGHTMRQIYAQPLPDEPAQGDVMYYDQTASRWVVLANPGTGSFVLTHDGDVPSWVEGIDATVDVTNLCGTGYNTLTFTGGILTSNVATSF